MKTFFYKYGEWGIKKSVLSFWFQKCKFHLSKKCTKKSFCQKLFCQLKHWPSPSFLCALFTKVKCTFLTSVFFDTPYRFKKKKNFHHKGSMCTFYELKVQNASNHSIVCKSLFYKQVLDFHHPFLCQTSGRQNHRSPTAHPRFMVL